MKILVAGDFSPKYKSYELIQKGQFKLLFDNIRQYTSRVDYSILNFETTIKKEGFKPIEKCGPHLNAPINVVDAIRYAGFNVVTLANNHFFDYGEKGVELTLQKFKENNINVVGGGQNLTEAEQILYLRCGDFRAAVVNCCESEFSIASETQGGSNPLNPIQQYYKIREAKEKSDYVLVIIHGGHEYFQLPSLKMQEVFRFFVDAGADCVINHHQHCFSGMEIYKERCIFYGLGNFLFDTKRHSYPDSWFEGFFVILNIDQKTSKADFEIVPYTQSYPGAGIFPINDEIGRQEFFKKFNELSTVIKDCKRLAQKIDKFYCKNIKESLIAFEPYSNRLLRAAYYRNILPSILRGKKRKLLLNYIMCESHLEKTKYLLNKIK